ncbi:MAG: hypothetical protein ACO1PN_11225 [Betaproteobacteria bacterium]
MKSLVAILAVTSLPFTAHAQIMKCIGAGGRVEFAAVCPPGTKAENTGIRNNPAAAPAGPQKSLAERDADFRKRATEQQEAAKKSEEKNQQTADQKQNCEAAKSYLTSLQSGNRIGKTDPATGERVFMEDGERASETARAQRAVESNCK